MQTVPSLLSLENPQHAAGKADGPPHRFLVVSIHDVSTVTYRKVDRMLKDFFQEGISVTSLLVIPDHHHKGRIDDDPEFSEWLRDQVSRGNEAVLHGFYHVRAKRNKEGLATRLITRSYTAGEGEFYDLSRDEAAVLLRRGREALHGCGIETTGFIAPAWLLGADAETAVKEEKFDYTTRIASVIDFKHERPFAARSMVYSVRAGWRRVTSLLWNEGLFRVLHKAPLLRIGLHPPDWEHRAIRRHIFRCIRQAVLTRKVTTYRNWLAQMTSSSHEGRLE